MAETNRGTIWDDKEVRALLVIWGEDKIQEKWMQFATRLCLRELQSSFMNRGLSVSRSSAVQKSRIKKNIYRQKIITKQAEGGNHASSSRSLMES